MHRLPFLRLALAIAFGIIFRQIFTIPNLLVWIAIGSSFFVVLFFAFSKSSLTIRYNPYLGTVGLLCLFFISYLRASTYVEPMSSLPENKVVAQLKVNQAPQEREKTYRIEATIEKYIHQDTVYTSDEKVLVYVSKEVPCSSWQINDRITLRARFDKIDSPKNPGEFNLKEYNARKSIYRRAFVRKEEVLEHEKGKLGFFSFFTQARLVLLKNFEERFSSPTEQALASALVLGYQENLDDETQATFSRSGTSHILAVSGLHVGIIWLIVSYLLSFLNRNQTQRIIKVILSLLILWSYAMLTGLSPSISRAAIMFSCFALAELIRRDYISLNVLCFSAAMQLVWNPMMIYSIGFQLSYAAVASILLFYKPIRNMFYFKPKWQRYIWEISALSISAQLLTTPISLYWFGQFPVWFLLSNIVLVPLSSIALGSGLFFLLFSWVPFLNDLLFHVFMLCIKFMQSLAAFFSHLPHAVIRIPFQFADILMAYALILCMALFFSSPSPNRLRFLLSCCCLLSAFVLFRSFIPTENRTVVYALKNGIVVRYIKEGDVYEYRTEDVDKGSYQFSVTPSDKLWPAKKVYSLQDTNGLISVGRTRIVLLQPFHLKNTLDKPLHCDWLFVDKLPFVDVKKIEHNFSFKTLFIFHEKNSVKEYLKGYCSSRGLFCYDVMESGAWVEEE